MKMNSCSRLIHRYEGSLMACEICAKSKFYKTFLGFRKHLEKIHGRKAYRRAGRIFSKLITIKQGQESKGSASEQDVQPKIEIDIASCTPLHRHLDHTIGNGVVSPEETGVENRNDTLPKIEAGTENQHHFNLEDNNSRELYSIDSQHITNEIMIQLLNEALERSTQATPHLIPLYDALSSGITITNNGTNWGIRMNNRTEFINLLRETLRRESLEAQHPQTSQ